MSQQQQPAKKEEMKLEVVREELSPADVEAIASLLVHWWVREQQQRQRQDYSDVCNEATNCLTNKKKESNIQ